VVEKYITVLEKLPQVLRRGGFFLLTLYSMNTLKENSLAINSAIFTKTDNVIFVTNALNLQNFNKHCQLMY